MTIQLKPCPYGPVPTKGCMCDACQSSRLDTANYMLREVLKERERIIRALGLPIAPEPGANLDGYPHLSELVALALKDRERLTAKIAECRAVLKEREFDDEDTTNYGLSQVWSCGDCGAVRADYQERKKGKVDEQHADNCRWLRAMTDEDPKT